MHTLQLIKADITVNESDAYCHDEVLAQNVVSDPLDNTILLLFAEYRHRRTALLLAQCLAHSHGHTSRVHQEEAIDERYRVRVVIAQK